MGFKITKIFESLQNKGLAAQVHMYHDETIIYHWNRNMTDLIQAVRVRGNKIEQVYYSRTIMPLAYSLINEEINIDLTGKEAFVRDKRKYAK
jgi:hypothetical protein